MFSELDAKRMGISVYPVRGSYIPGLEEGCSVPSVKLRVALPTKIFLSYLVKTLSFQVVFLK